MVFNKYNRREVWRSSGLAAWCRQKVTGYAWHPLSASAYGQRLNTGHSQRLVAGCAASLSHPYRKTFRQCPVFRATLHCKDFHDRHATLRLFSTHGARQYASWLILHYCAYRLAFSGVGLGCTNLFYFSAKHFKRFSSQYVDVRFHRRGYLAPVYCDTINYGSNYLLGLLNVADRDILCLSVEKISRPPRGRLVFFPPRANIPLRQPRGEYNEQAKLR